MKRSILIFAALAAWTACAQSARLGSLGRNDMVVTNIGEIARAASYGTDTQWTDATGCVWRVVDAHYGEWSYSGVPEGFVFSVNWEGSVSQWQWTLERWGGGEEYGQGMCQGESTDLALDIGVGLDFFSGTIQCRRSFYPYGTNLVGRTALTNDIPRTPGAVGAYPAASGSALESGKQDRLPYPTNAIPFSAIDGAPSGGQEWTISVQDSDFIEFVTNGIARVRWWDYSYTDISDMSAWPDGAAMFVRFEKQQTITSWTVGNRIHLVGYGTWPTNNFQSVWWRSGTNIYVNVILEE